MSNSDVDVATQADAGDSLLGATLRQAREGKGITVEEAAAQLNLTPGTLECIENDQYDTLPGVTFIRGYIRSYGNLLGLDGSALSKQYVEDEQVKEGVKPLHNIEHERKSRARFFVISLVLLLLVIAGLAGYWWLEQQDVESSQAQSSTPIEHVEIEGVDGTLHIQSLDELDAQTATMSVEEIHVVEPEPTETQALNDVVAPENEGEAQAAAAQPAEKTEQQDVLELSFIEDSWIRVTNALGEEVASGLKRAGDVIKLTGAAPFEIHLGYAQGVFITFNGQPIDFDAKIRGNVARLKLG